MSLLEFLSSLRSRGGALSIEGDQLRITAPAGVLTPGLQQEISRRKKEILAFLAGARLSADQASQPIPCVPRDCALPLSFAQQSLWFLDNMDPGTCTYTMSATIHLTGQLDSSAVTRALHTIVKRHEILRTVFPSEDGQPVQHVPTDPIMTFPVVELLAASTSDRKSELRRLIMEEARQPFDLTRGPLFRAKLLRMDESEHILLLNVHHIIFDRWSLAVLMSELAELYGAYSSGKSPLLPELPIQYSDYACFQRHLLRNEGLEHQLAYWKHQLVGSSPIVPLPTDCTQTPIQTHHGARQDVSFPVAVIENLDALCRRERVTRYIVLLAVLKVLLYRYSAQEDIVVGTPMAGRTRTEYEGLIGLFVNTLVIRTSLSGNPTFCEFVARVRDVLLEAHSHQDVPFERLVEELRPERTLAHSPLFQVMFSFQNQSFPSEFHGVSCRIDNVYNGTAKYDLTLELSETRDGVKGCFEYNTDLFDADTLSRMAGHLETLACSVLADPDQRLSDVPFLHTTERQQILQEWNNTTIDYPRDRCVHQLFEEQVERTPHATAVVFRGYIFTYLELNQQSNQVARRLRTLNVGHDSTVAICLERSPEMVVGLLGILKAGGTYVPLDPTIPIERLSFMMAEVKASVVLTSEKLAKQLQGNSTLTVCSSSDGLFIKGESTMNLPCEVTEENLIYIIYTSGSTGQPKGSGIYQKGFVNLLNWYMTEFALGENDKVLLVSNPSFDLTQKNIFAPLLVGAQLHIPDSSFFDPFAIAELISRERITLVNCTPSMFFSILDADNTEGLVGLASLRCVFLGGESINGSRLTELLGSALHDTLIVNTYGPAECTDVCTFHVLKDLGISFYERIPIGRPISNAKVFIMDQNLCLLPIGLTGEICVGGECVGVGYVNDNNLTMVNFVSHPLCGRIYRTGDIGRWRSDGAIEFLGRADQQVKIRGIRVETGEVKAILEQHPRVSQVLVVARNDNASEWHLVAYVVIDENTTHMVKELREFAKKKLPNYMIPSSFVILNAMPLTPNGKVDQRALPCPRKTRPDMEAVYAPPRTLTEKAIREIWTRVLDIDEIGVHDNFFDLGGNSLLLVQVASRIRVDLAADVSVVDLFRFPTISSLAEHLNDQGSLEGMRKAALRPIADRARRQIDSVSQHRHQERNKVTDG